MSLEFKRPAFRDIKPVVRPIDHYAHVIWDWNGTLFDDVDLCVGVMNKLLSRRAMNTLTVEDYRESFGFPVHDYYRRLGFDFQAEPFEVVGTEFILEYEERRQEAKLYFDAREALERIQESGAGQSILSAYQQPMLEELIQFFDLAGFFVRLVGLQDHYAHGKLDNGVEWMRQLGHDPEDVLLVGDTMHDCEVARAMGIDCALIAGGHQSASRLQGNGVPVIAGRRELFHPVAEEPLRTEQTE